MSTPASRATWLQREKPNSSKVRQDITLNGLIWRLWVLSLTLLTLLFPKHWEHNPKGNCWHLKKISCHERKAKKFWQRNSAGLTCIFVSPCKWGKEAREVIEFMPLLQKVVHCIGVHFFFSPDGASWLNWAFSLFQG